MPDTRTPQDATEVLTGIRDLHGPMSGHSANGRICQQQCRKPSGSVQEWPCLTRTMADIALAVMMPAG